MQVNGEIKRAQLELLGADPSGAANLVLGRIWQNTADARFKVADGTKSKEVLLNDDKVILGTSTTLAENIRIHRAGVALLQFVTANDATVEGTLSTNTAKLSFQFESYTTAGRPANGKVGRVILDTDLNVLLVDDGTNWVSTANGTEISQCFINLGTASNTNVIVLSSDTKANLDLLTRKSGALYYATDENKYYGDDGLNLIDLGSGSGSGFNYIENGKAETNTSGWVLYSNTTPDVRPDDFGGTPAGLTFTRDTINNLIGKASFKLSKDAVNRQGQGVYYQFTNEKGHATSPCVISMVSDLSHANFLDGDLSIHLAVSSDNFVTTSNVIDPTNPDILAGVIEVLKRTQFESGVKQYRLCIHVRSTNALAYDTYFDDIQLGPKASVTGASEDYGTSEIFVNAEGNGGTSVTANTTNVSFTSIITGSGFFDGSVFTATQSGVYDFNGNVYVTAQGVFSIESYINGVAYRRAGYNELSTGRSGDFPITIPLLKGQTVSFRLDTTKTLDNTASRHFLTISKKSSPQSIWESEEVSFSSNSTNGQTIADGSNIIYENVSFDSHSDYNSGTGIYTISKSGRLSVNASAVRNATGQMAIDIELNGSPVSGDNRADATVNTVVKAHAIIDVLAGDEIQVVNSSGASRTLDTVSKYNLFSIYRLK